MMTALFTSLLSVIPAANSGEPEVGYAETLVDFVEAFESATVENTLETSVSEGQTSGGVSLPGIFQHPLNDGAARLTYQVELPSVRNNDRIALVFSLGLRDGVNLDDPNIPTDGVVCGVEVNGTRFFEAVVHRTEWRDFSVDLSGFGGKNVALSFVAEAGDNSNFDWLLWGNPRLYCLRVASGKERPSRLHAGLQLLVNDAGQTQIKRFDFDGSKSYDDAMAAFADDALDTGAVKIGAYSFTPRLVIRSLSSGNHLLFQGKDYEARCVVENIGEAAVEGFHQVYVGVSGAALRRGRADRHLSTLEPGESATLTWQMRGAIRREATEITVSIKSGVDGITDDETVVAVFEFQSSLPPMPSRTTKEVRSLVQNEYALLENEYLRVAFAREEGTYPYFVLFAQKGANLQQVATTSPISKLVYLDNAGKRRSMEFVPTKATMGGTNGGDATIYLSCEQADADGVMWRFRAGFTLYEDSRRVEVDYRTAPSEPRNVVHFAGPMLRVGDGGQGERKEFAIFPGLEMLERDEASSSERDAAPPLHKRLVPHPYKVTVPAMAVQQNGITTGVLWNPLNVWGEHDERGVSAIFDSPNRHEGEDNHLLGVFLPTVPDFVPENATQAKTPYQVGVDGIILKAQMFTDPKGTIWDAPDIWGEAYGYPKPVEPPRTDEEELFLSRHGFMVTTWDEATEKSRHCYDWAPANSPGFATLMWYDYLATADQAVGERVALIAKKTIEEQGAQGLASTANCHILQWEFPFHYGYVLDGLDGARAQIERILDAQGSDGSWRFRATDDKRATLGKSGDATLGTCARNALTLLKYARISGDDDALQAGLKALKFMEQFTVPRGAQAWECPLYEPDILAAAYAVGAYLEADSITGDATHREKAEYWAKTGLPFLYFWHLPDRVAQQYASIPVFGTTFYTHPWFGVPVQWNGLVYAYYIQRLARFSEYPWAQVAEGITVSAMHQQWTEGDLKGTYPDGLYGQFLDGKGPHINPEDIMVNLLALRGHDPDISTGILTSPGGTRVHISSGARVSAIETRDDSLQFRLSGFPGHRSHVFIGNIPLVESVHIDGDELAIGETPEAVQGTGGAGWHYDADRRAVAINLAQHAAELRVSVTFAPIAEQLAYEDEYDEESDEYDEPREDAPNETDDSSEEASRDNAETPDSEPDDQTSEHEADFAGEPDDEQRDTAPFDDSESDDVLMDDEE